MDKGNIKYLWDKNRREAYEQFRRDVDNLIMRGDNKLSDKISDRITLRTNLENFKVRCGCSLIVSTIIENGKILSSDATLHKPLPDRYENSSCSFHTVSALASKYDSKVFIIVSKHGAWAGVYKKRIDAIDYVSKKGYYHVKEVTDFGLTKVIYQHPDQDREYSIFEVEIM